MLLFKLHYVVAVVMKPSMPCHAMPAVDCTAVVADLEMLRKLERKPREQSKTARLEQAGVQKLKVGCPVSLASV